MKPTLKLLAFGLLAPHASFAETTGDVREVRVVRSTGEEPRASLLGHRRSIRFGKLTLKGNP
jgi:hypothetical protein